MPCGGLGCACDSPRGNLDLGFDVGIAAFGLEGRVVELEGRLVLPPAGRDISGVSFVFFNRWEERV